MEEDQLTKLAYCYTFWFSFFKENKMKQVDDYENNIKPIGDFDTAEEFWGFYQHIRRPDFLPKGCEFFLFKKGMRPLWEDPSNKGGGRFVLHIKKMFANKTWEDILIAFIIAGQDFDKLNGIIINIRSWEVLLSVWMKPLPTDEEREYYRSWIRSSLGMTENINIEYKPHPNPDDLK
jgi:translation initiation factor 4E